MSSPIQDADHLARNVADAMLEREGTASNWGLVIETAKVGYARVRMVLRADMLNGHRTAHGGMIFALADTAFAYACNSRNQITVAQQASIHFLAPAHEGDVLIAEAYEDAVIGRSGSYRVDVRTKAGRPIAYFQGLSRTIGGAILPLEE
ncbi:hydroxyphenylacetyl-CoA thioesterase PaaI [Sphingomonas crocodyli]|uniref:Hydroxyphenylacetyl-CoA thioesterase PaaI n=1 Tax=Sphingomonas crocodyli TaxID=1979270 RepID=A0A437M7D8_9SPHN|nr:hydroxyphenylacetyl-CoA thioesterase PaaI [Sphingomonas crocodyli]RVT93547.1 hydroxyphenylacetyl-CoA thioesterase PaaI [Sphingomonas crocodyli]